MNYKLIKSYPHCGFKLGDIVSDGISNTTETFWDVKHYPEFWEEIKEPIICKVLFCETILTVGDKFRVCYNEKIYTIKSFSIEDNILVICDEDNYAWCINDTIKKVIKLFTTEDGIDVYDPFQFVYSYNKDWNVCCFKAKDYDDKYGKIFSTPESLNKFIKTPFSYFRIN